jgi:hypothetical protein
MRLVAGLSWTGWDKIQNPLTADVAASARTDKWRTKALPIPRQSEKLQVSGYSDGCGETVCKTVGSAYVGSNPTPATTSGNGP